MFHRLSFSDLHFCLCNYFWVDFEVGYLQELYNYVQCFVPGGIRRIMFLRRGASTTHWCSAVSDGANGTILYCLRYDAACDRMMKCCVYNGPWIVCNVGSGGELSIQRYQLVALWLFNVPVDTPTYSTAGSEDRTRYSWDRSHQRSPPIYYISPALFRTWNIQCPKRTLIHYAIRAFTCWL